MEHIMPKRASLLMKITFVAAFSALFMVKPVSASEVTTFHIETNVETKERIKKRDKKAKKTHVVKKKSYDSYTKTYPGTIDTVSVKVDQKTVKKKYLKKEKEGTYCGKSHYKNDHKDRICLFRPKILFLIRAEGDTAFKYLPRIY